MKPVSKFRVIEYQQEVEGVPSGRRGEIANVYEFSTLPYAGSPDNGVVQRMLDSRGKFYEPLQSILNGLINKNTTVRFETEHVVKR